MAIIALMHIIAFRVNFFFFKELTLTQVYEVVSLFTQT